MNYITTRLFIMFFALAAPVNLLRAHTPSIDLLALIALHNTSSKDLAQDAIATNKKIKKSPKKLNALQKMYIKAKLIAVAPLDYAFGQEPCMAKKIFGGVAGLAALGLAIYTYTYMFGLKEIQEPHDKPEISEMLGEDIPKNVPVIELPEEKSVEDQLSQLKENSNQIPDVVFPDQACPAQEDTIVPIEQTVQNVSFLPDEPLSNTSSVSTVQETIATQNIHFDESTQDVTIKTDELKVELVSVEHTMVDEEFSPDIIPQEQVHAEIVEDTQEALELPGQDINQDVSDNTSHVCPEQAEQQPFDDESSIQKKIAQLKWQDETTYEDWQEIIRLQNYLDELRKRNKV